MGMKVQCKSFLPRGGYKMRDPNEDSITCGRSSLYYEEKSLTDSQFYNGFFPNLANASYPGYDKDSVKQKMLEHEAIFKTQVCELHRLYRVQRDMMNGLLQRKELHRNGSHLGSQNGFRMEDIEVSESRPSKVRRKTFDLQLPADEYIDTGKKGDQPRNGVKLYCDRKSVEDRSNGFADPNEPARFGDVREMSASSPYKVCNGKICDSDRSVKKPSSSQVLSFTNEISLSSYGREVDAQSDSHLHKSRIVNEWLSRVPEVGQRKSHPEFPLSLKQTQVSTSKVHRPTFYRKEETVFGAEISVRPRDLTSDSNVPSLSISSPELANKPWFHNLERPSSTFGHKQLSAQTNGAQDWFLGSNAASKPAFANRLFQGSEEQAIRISSNDRDPGRWTGKASHRVDMNLNEAVSECLSTREMPVSGLEKKSNEDRRSVLPWLRPPKLVCKNGAVRFEPIPITCEISFSQSPLSQSPNSMIDKAKDCDLNSNPSDSQSSNNKRLLGFPIFENSRASEKNQTVVSKARTVLDMNLPCEQIEEESVIVANVTDADAAISFRHQIDLNSCLSDDDEEEQQVSLKPSSTPIAREKIVTEIDLEAPPIPDPEEQEESYSSKPSEEEEEKSIAGAAEAIVAISASVFLLHTDEEFRQKLVDPLAWLAEIVSSLADADVALESDGEESDFFETMTLKLAETDEVVEIPTPEVGPALQASRGRKGSSGRRDILPGLASLSRHEVTEDLQFFGGLMRAVGQPGPSKRGRRRAAVDPPPPMLVETGLEDRSLTGWGKITRRPRRQRCPSGNPTLVVMN